MLLLLGELSERNLSSFFVSQLAFFPSVSFVVESLSIKNLISLCYSVAYCQ